MALEGERDSSFAEIPTIVAAFYDDVDFLALILSDVGAEEGLRLHVPVDAPRIAQPKCPDFGAIAFLADEWIILGDSVRKVTRAGIHVDAENLAM